jgi:hypothetical protein
MQFDQLKRRQFITLLVGAAAAWPLAARAQQSAKPPTIGFLGSTTPSTMSQWVAAFVQRLRELGWIEGRTVAIEYRWAEGRSERFAEIASLRCAGKPLCLAPLSRGHSGRRMSRSLLWQRSSG